MDIKKKKEKRAKKRVDCKKVFRGYRDTYIRKYEKRDLKRLRTTGEGKKQREDSKKPRQ